MSGLSFKNISKKIDDDAGFSGFSLAVDAGEFVALVGKNGCGKAELIHIAEGYGGRFHGEVLIDGRRVTKETRGHNMASLVTDIPIIGTPGMEMRRVLRSFGISREDMARRIDEAAEVTGLTGKLNIRYSKLDNEYKLRAGLARAYAAGAKVALMIDPFASAENRMAARMMRAVMEFRAKTGMTFVMSTNSASSALSLATRIVMMVDGKVLQSDTTQNIYDFPANRTVAEYFGAREINMIPAKLERAGEEVHAVFGDIRILVPGGKLAKLVDQSYIGKNVLLGVRPENIRYEQAFVTISPDSAFEATVKYIELMGSETYLHIEPDGMKDTVVARVDPRCIAKVGGTIMLAIDSNRLHMFDAETGKTILSKL